MTNTNNKREKENKTVCVSDEKRETPQLHQQNQLLTVAHALPVWRLRSKKILWPLSEISQVERQVVLKEKEKSIKEKGVGVGERPLSFFSRPL